MCLAFNNTRHSPPLNRARYAAPIAPPRLRPFLLAIPPLTLPLLLVFPLDSPYFPFVSSTSSSSSLDVAIIYVRAKHYINSLLTCIFQHWFRILRSRYSLRNLREFLLVLKFNFNFFFHKIFSIINFAEWKCIFHREYY